jgi:hypothetical protein
MVVQAGSGWLSLLYCTLYVSLDDYRKCHGEEFKSKWLLNNFENVETRILTPYRLPFFRAQNRQSRLDFLPMLETTIISTSQTLLIKVLLPP